MKLSRPTRVLVIGRPTAEQNRLLAFLERRPDIAVRAVRGGKGGFTGEAAWADLCGQIGEARPDVIVVDPGEPPSADLAWMGRLEAVAPVPLVAFTACDSDKRPPAGPRFFEVVRRPVNGDAAGELMALRLLAYAIRRAALKAPEEEAPPRLAAGGAALIAMGASAGGTEAILAILAALPRAMPPILVVQHIAPGFAETFAAHIEKRTGFLAGIAAEGTLARPGRVYVAPDGRHLRVEKRAEEYALRLAEGARISGHLPSIDALFHSVAEQAGDAAVGVLLTGMGRDGAAGLKHMREKGAMTIGQDEGTSLVYGMPRAALEMGAVARQLPLDKIAAELIGLAHKGETGHGKDIDR